MGRRSAPANAASENVLAFARLSTAGARIVLVLANLSPVVRYGWRVGVPEAGVWREVLNTDSRFYGGSDVGTSSASTCTVFTSVQK